MQIVIELSDEIYKDIKEENSIYGINNGLSARMTGKVVGAIQNGKPLPKGHGRLKDADELLKAMNTWDKFGFDHTGCFVREPKDDFITYVHYEDMVKAVRCTPTIIEADKEQKDTYKYLLNGAESLVKEHPDLVRDIWNCSSCEHTEDECKDCYPELGYKNNKLKRDTEAVKEFVESDTFKHIMNNLDDTQDAVDFLRDIEAHKRKGTEE